MLERFLAMDMPRNKRLSLQGFQATGGKSYRQTCALEASLAENIKAVSGARNLWLAMVAGQLEGTKRVGAALGPWPDQLPHAVLSG